jgi:hypothetical protein
MRLLVNELPTVVEGDKAREATKDLSCFTASMVCIVAALDQFGPLDFAKQILRGVLKIFLVTSEHGKDYLKSEYLIRLRACAKRTMVRRLARIEDFHLSRQVLSWERQGLLVSYTLLVAGLLGFPTTVLRNV